MNLSSEYILAQHKAQQNRFVLLTRWIKTTPVTQVDVILHPIAQQVTQQIDCTACGNCCREQQPGITMAEAETLANLQQMPVNEFMDLHVAWDRDGTSFMCTQPCIFLQGNKCGVYIQRPSACADFPGLHRPHIKWRWKQVEENMTICPIVFYTVQKLYTLLHIE